MVPTVFPALSPVSTDELFMCLVRLWYKDFYLTFVVAKKQTRNTFVLFFAFLRQGFSVCNSPDCPGTHSVDHAGLKLRDPPAAAF